MTAHLTDDDYPGGEYDLRHAPWHFEPALDFLLWFRPELTEAEAQALIERFEQETAPQLRNFKPGKGAYLPHAMRDYWSMPLCPDAALPETNIVTRSLRRNSNQRTMDMTDQSDLRDRLTQLVLEELSGAPASSPERAKIAAHIMAELAHQLGVLIGM